MPGRLDCFCPETNCTDQRHWDCAYEVPREAESDQPLKRCFKQVLNIPLFLYPICPAQEIHLL